jgi:hypothetical protein
MNLYGRSIRNINRVLGVTGRLESGRGGMRLWIQARLVSVAASRIAGFKDLFRPPSKPGTDNSRPLILSGFLAD